MIIKSSTLKCVFFNQHPELLLIKPETPCIIIGEIIIVRKLKNTKNFNIVILSASSKSREKVWLWITKKSTKYTNNLLKNILKQNSE